MSVKIEDSWKNALSKEFGQPYFQAITTFLRSEIGAGKTTLIKQICKELGVEGDMSSPTFSIVNEYASTSGEEIYHFDFYRLREVEEAIDIGAEDYFFSGNLCLIEWPALVEPMLPDEYLQINIKLVGNNARSLTAEPK